MNEAQLHSIVKSNIKQLSDIERTTYDKFCSYDAYNGKGIIEYKCRRKWYKGGTQLEKPKFDKNIKDPDRDYIYIVYDGVGRVHVWNVSKLMRNDYDFQWTTRMCPKTTDFNRNEYIEKTVGILKWDDAIFTLQVKPKEKN